MGTAVDIFVVLYGVLFGGGSRYLFSVWKKLSLFIFKNYFSHDILI